MATAPFTQQDLEELKGHLESALEIAEDVLDDVNDSGDPDEVERSNEEVASLHRLLTKTYGMLGYEEGEIVELIGKEPYQIGDEEE